MIPSGKADGNYRYHFKRTGCAGDHAHGGRKVSLLSSSRASFARNYAGGFTADFSYAGPGEVTE